MATRDEDKKEAPAAAREAAKEAAAEAPEDAETYDHDWLVQAANALGYQPWEVAGALSAVTKKNLTIEEAQEATKKWLASPVKTEA